MHDPFASQATWYARYRPTYPDSVFAWLAAKAPQPSIALDCGTGSGQAAVHLARHFARVLAVDLSLPQMAEAIAAPNIHYVGASAERTCFRSDTFDCIVASQAVHWFDFERFYDEVRRVARTGALVCLLGYSRVQLVEPLGSVIDKLYDEMFGRYYSANRRYVEESYRTLPFPFDEIDPLPFSIVLTWDLTALEGYVTSWSSLQRYRRETGQDPVPTLMTRIRELAPDLREITARFHGFMRVGHVT
jgi:SAM-dependent methyltransferase